VKNKTAIYSALIVCIALQISAASAQGIPLAFAPERFLGDTREVCTRQTQIDAMRASHNTAANPLLAPIRASVDRFLNFLNL
jgi:hypothetical protein